MPWTEIIASQLLFQNSFNLRMPKVTSFAVIIKIAAMFIKKTFRDSKKRRLKELEIIY